MYSRIKCGDFLIDPTKVLGHLSPAEQEFVLNVLKENKIQLKLNILDSDPGDLSKPTIVLIHGNSASKKVFEDQIKHFSKNYRVMAVDLLGHGDSTKISIFENLSAKDKDALCAAFYNPQAMIAEVASVLEARGVTHAHFVGWSLGGHIAYGIGVSHPSLVASVSSIGSPPVLFSYEGFKKGFNDWFVNVLLPEWVNQAKFYTLEEAATVGKHIGFDGKDCEIFAADMAISDPQMRRHLFLKINDYDVAAYLRSPLDGERFVCDTDKPVCLFVGEKDAGISAAYIASLTGKLHHPASKIHVVAGASHAVFKTHADLYYDLLDGFIKQSIESKLGVRISS